MKVLGFSHDVMLIGKHYSMFVGFKITALRTCNEKAYNCYVVKSCRHFDLIGVYIF